jgi:hypothetical protein
MSTEKRIRYKEEDDIKMLLQELKNLKENSSENLYSLISKNAGIIAPLLEKYMSGRKTMGIVDYIFHLILTVLVVGVISLIVWVSFTLTEKKVIDGSTFTFLLGLLVGYLLTYMKNFFDTGTG